MLIKHNFRKSRVCQTRVKNTKEYGKILKQAVKRLTVYISDIQHVFQVGKHNVQNTAIDYLKGLWPSYRSNLERISETGICKNYFHLQHFISDSPWEARDLMDYISNEARSKLKGTKLVGLHIDESGVRKKGKHTVGTAPQYCGNVGKVDNSQIAVFAVISQGDFATLVDSRLYLPKCWTSNKPRLDRAKVPVECWKFKTKQELALDIINHQISIGTKFDYLEGDAYYGADQKFTDAIDNMAIPFVMDIRENQHVFLEEPLFEIPQPKLNRGRKPGKPKANIVPIPVREYVKTLTHLDFMELKVKNTAKGKLKCLYHFKTVFIWDGVSKHASKRLLIIRKSAKKRKPEVTYSLGNIDLAQYSPGAIAYMAGPKVFH